MNDYYKFYWKSAKILMITPHDMTFNLSLKYLLRKSLESLLREHSVQIIIQDRIDNLKILHFL